MCGSEWLNVYAVWGVGKRNPGNDLEASGSKKGRTTFPNETNALWCERYQMSLFHIKHSHMKQSCQGHCNMIFSKYMMVRYVTNVFTTTHFCVKYAFWFQM